MSDLAQALIVYGPLGVICVGLSIACGYLHKELLKSQELRVADAQKVSDTLLAVNEESNKIITDLTRALDANNRTVDALVNHMSNGTGKTDVVVPRDNRIDVVVPRRGPGR